jgi:RNA methyltransferase, TrmH family
MKTVTSRQNSLFKRIREAVREHADEIVLEGPKAVADALAGGWKPLAIVTRGDADRHDAVAFAPELYDALAVTKSPQGVIGLFRRPQTTAEEILVRRNGVAVALDGVQDPGNVGTIVRLAAAFDAMGVLLLPGCADPYGPKAIRSSVGAILSVPVASVTTRELLDADLPLFAADATGTQTDPPPRAAILLFGNEGAGVSDELLRASEKLAIPMSGRVESLNVASSAAILLSRSFALRNPS